MQVVRRSGHMADVVSIDYKTADISATAGKDYEATEGTLTFQVGRRTMQSTTCTRTVHVHVHVACTWTCTCTCMHMLHAHVAHVHHVMYHATHHVTSR